MNVLEELEEAKAIYKGLQQMYSGEMVKFGSNRDGAKETILRVDDIGTDNNRSTINNINTTMANIIFPPLDLDQ